MSEQPIGIGLSEALNVLRTELATAHMTAITGDLQFPIESLTVDLKVGLTRSKEGKAGFTVPFIGVDVGGSAGRQLETIQTVTVVLGSPTDRDGRPIKVSSFADEEKE